MRGFRIGIEPRVVATIQLLDVEVVIQAVDFLADSAVPNSPDDPRACWEQLCLDVRSSEIVKIKNVCFQSNLLFYSSKIWALAPEK